MTNMKTILAGLILLTLVLFASPIMAQESVVVLETGKYIMIASTDKAAFAQKVAEILNWTGTVPGVDRFFPLGMVMISIDPVTNDSLYMQHFTLFRDQSCPSL